LALFSRRPPERVEILRLRAAENLRRKQTHALQQRTDSALQQKIYFQGLFDHVVRERQQRIRNGNANSPGSREVDNQLEFCRLFNRQVGWFFAFEDAAGVDAGLLIYIYIFEKLGP
jgi:hypothetical protein